MNCLILDDEDLSRNALKQLVSQTPSLQIQGVCSNVSEAFQILSEKRIDLMFLDIEMPDMNGMDFLRSLKKPPLTILATGKREYAIDAYECNVVDYLVKPIYLDRFFKACERAIRMYDAEQQRIISPEKEYFFAKINGTLERIRETDILWIEALGDYITVNTIDRKYIVHSTMKAVQDKLAADRFIRVHRSYIVAINQVSSIDDAVISIEKQLIPVGAVYKENLIRRLTTL